MLPPPPRSTLFPYTTLFRSGFRTVKAATPRPMRGEKSSDGDARSVDRAALNQMRFRDANEQIDRRRREDRKSTRLNSSHVEISYAVFCLKKKNNTNNKQTAN